MVDENSIYNIVEHNSSVVYNKHDIVAVFERFSEFSVPKSVKYYYSLTDNNRDNTPAADSSFWGGVTSFSDTTKAKFVWAPSYNTQVEHKPRVNSISYSLEKASNLLSFTTYQNLIMTWFLLATGKCLSASNGIVTLFFITIILFLPSSNKLILNNYARGCLRYDR